MQGRPYCDTISSLSTDMKICVQGDAISEEIHLHLHEMASDVSLVL